MFCSACRCPSCALARTLVEARLASSHPGRVDDLAGLARRSSPTLDALAMPQDVRPLPWHDNPDEASRRSAAQTDPVRMVRPLAPLSAHDLEYPAGPAAGCDDHETEWR